jgi:hypothetical protein
MENSNDKCERVLAYRLAKKLTHEELNKVAGGLNGTGHSTTYLTGISLDERWDSDNH